MKKPVKKKMTADMKAVAKHEKVEKKMEKEGYMKSGGKMKKKC